MPYAVQLVAFLAVLIAVLFALDRAVTRATVANASRAQTPTHRTPAAPPRSPGC